MIPDTRQRLEGALQDLTNYAVSMTTCKHAVSLLEGQSIILNGTAGKPLVHWQDGVAGEVEDTVELKAAQEAISSTQAALQT